LIWRRQQISNRCKLVAFTLFVFLAFGSCIYSGHYVFAQTDQTVSKLQAANTAVEQAFNAVLAAEHAGANVTALLAGLNDATGFLAEAEMANRAGNFTAVESDVDSAISIASQSQAAAVDAEEAASVSGSVSFSSTIIFSFLGAVAFVCVWVLVWRWQKRRYIRNLSDAKPEVTNS
jgi:Trk-type K+ transport system membrane component